MKRTMLPLNALRVLDAAARHLSFTRAADELAVTPAAVGQQIRALEDMLGVVLFRRTTKGLELTPEAEGGLDALRSGFLMFEESVRAMQSGQSSKSLTIAAPRDFTAKWLTPKLAEYGRADPELRFTLLSGDAPLDFTEANLDIAIRLTDGPGEHEGVPLADGEFITITGTESRAETLIGWPGSPVSAEGATLRLADAGLAIDAAANGLGKAVVPHLLAQSDLDSGRVRALDNGSPHKMGYWLIAPLPQWRQKKVQAFVAAMTA